MGNVDRTSAAAQGQESARRVGICLTDYEMFWWRADDGEPCPVCNVNDDDYALTHRFYVAEAESDA